MTVNIIRIILSLAANLDWGFQQLDIGNVFLNGDQSVDMDIHPVCKENINPTRVCKRKILSMDFSNFLMLCLVVLKILLSVLDISIYLHAL